MPHSLKYQSIGPLKSLSSTYTTGPLSFSSNGEAVGPPLVFRKISGDVRKYSSSSSEHTAAIHSTKFVKQSFTGKTPNSTNGTNEPRSWMLQRQKTSCPNLVILNTERQPET